MVHFARHVQAARLEAGPMPTRDAPPKLYGRFIALSRKACASGLYAAAYHALAAAMHCGIEARDAAQLAEVEAIAQDQLEWIDTHTPTHPRSRKSSVGEAATISR